MLTEEEIRVKLFRAESPEVDLCHARPFRVELSDKLAGLVVKDKVKKPSNDGSLAFGSRSLYKWANCHTF